MNDLLTQSDQARIIEARRSFTGKGLSEAQFDHAIALSGVIDREIRRTGKFREVLTDYAHAFARTEKFDALKGEVIIRDIFKARYGQTMNQRREALMEREAAVRDTARDQSLAQARGIEPMIRQGETMPFHEAFDRSAVQLASTLGITEAGAKTMMRESYQSAEGRELYEVCKAAEREDHLPKIEAAREARKAEQDMSGAQTRTRQLGI